MTFLKKRIIWVSVILDIVVVDQISKWLVAENIPRNTIALQFFGDFFRLVHVRNTGAAFSMGGQWPDLVRMAVFSVFPIIVLCFLVFYLVTDKNLTFYQCMALSGIAGGGFGNLIDRIFRSDGVVDFLDVKFYGLFGMERWPTFNVADSCVVVAGIILFLSYFIEERKRKGAEADE